MKYVSRDKTYSTGTNKIFIKALCVAKVYAVQKSAGETQVD